ncbi:ABC transporter permease [Alphaproteobacteria bacterium]|nr:ABC transporter permease [Alphaproteobacteria bacterium]
MSNMKNKSSLFNIPTTGSTQLDLGLVMFAIIVLALIIQIIFLGEDFLDGNLRSRLKPPGYQGHIFGTDQLGRDLFFRVMGGLPWSLGISGVAVICVAVIGTTIGLIGAWYDNWIRTIVLLGVSAMIAMPFLVLALVVTALFERGFWTLSLTMGFIAWTAVSRVIYAEARGLLTREYVLAARLFGVSKWSILIFHILPGLRPTILVMAAFFFAVLLIIESALSFLGLGAPLNAPSWGNMLSDSRQYLMIAPWMMLVPAITIVWSVISLNLIGDGIAELSRKRARAVEV